MVSSPTGTKQPSPIVTERFRLADLKLHDLVADPTGWYRVRVACGPSRMWRHIGPGRWVHDHDEVTSTPYGEKRLKHYVLEPAVGEVEYLSGKELNGLLTASNRWVSLNQFVQSVRLPIYNSDSGQDRGTCNPDRIEGDVSRMLAVLSFEPTSPPPSQTDSLATSIAAAMLTVLQQLGVLPAKTK
jgi:hypothetical protein